MDDTRTTAQQAAAASGAPALTPLQRVLLAALDGLSREPSGQELWDELHAQAADDLALLEQAELTARETAQLRCLAGRIFEQPRLAELIRGGVVESIAAAMGDPKAWLLACRALKHVPAWALETAPEREARVEAELEWKRSRGRPGQGTAQSVEGGAEAGRELFGDSSQAQRPAPPAYDGSQARRPAPPDAPRLGTPPRPPAFTSARAWRDYRRRDDNWRDPLKQFDLLDQEVLEAVMPRKERREDRTLIEEAMHKIRGGWTDMAKGSGPLGRNPVRNPLRGASVTPDFAWQQLDRIKREWSMDPLE